MNDFNNKKTLILSLFVMSLGLVMIFGTSYSIITKSYLSDNNYSLKVGNIAVNFGEQENNITLSDSYPISDREALENGKEFSFTINNLGDYTANYSLSIEETSKEKLGEIIRFSYNLNDVGYTAISTLSENNIVCQNVVLEKEKVDTYKMKFWISEETNASYMGKTFSAKLVLNTTQNDYKYATSVIELLGTNKQDGIVGINKEGKVSENDIIEYRYTGLNPLNYLWFNCDEGYTKGESHCEKWRIIGSMDNTWENGLNYYKTLKIIRTDSVENIKYDDISSSDNYNKSYLNSYANNDYYNNLSLSAKNMILNAKWNIGQTSNDISASESYNNEKAEFVYNDVGVISPSDYGFANDYKEYDKKLNNQSKNWLYFENSLLLNKLSDGNILIMNSYNEQFGIVSGDNNNAYAFVPSVYLKPDVSIIDGYGTYDEPYEIDIKFPMSYGTVDKNN